MTALRAFWLLAPKRDFHLATGHFRSYLLVAFAVSALALLSGCPSKTPVAQAPPPPSPPAPTATIAATPATVQAGQPVVITWKTENATDVSIDPMGAMPASGSATVTPSESATYRLTAKGPGGVLEADARITVAAAGSSAEGPTAGNDEELFLSGESPRFDIFFEFNESSITENQFVTIKSDAQFLKQHPDLRIVVEGHCDQTGSSEYNLALGDRRANMVKSALEKAGVSSSRMRSISYGKEQLFCEEETDACLRQNRRVHIAPDIER